MLTLLGSGQSNAMGFNPGGPMEFDPRLTVWDNANDTYDDGTQGVAFVSPEAGRPPFVGEANCFMIHAASEIARLTGETVRLVLVTKGGIPISEWIDDAGKHGPMLDRILAITERADVKSVDGFLWHQGEGDNKAPATYPAKWDALQVALRTAQVLGPQTITIVGETAAMWPRINAVLPTLVANTPNCAFVPLADMETSDGRHFLGKDALVIGRRYAQAFLRLRQSRDQRHQEARTS